MNQPIKQKEIPRYYQREARENLAWGWEEHRRQVVNIATGGGKTFVAADTMAEMMPARSLFIADQEELCSQPRAVIRRATGLVAGLEQGRNRASLDARIVIASSQTLQKMPRRSRFPKDHFGYIFIDECHRRTDADIESADYFEAAYVAGLTGTNFRQDMADLSKWYSNVACEMPLINLREEGFAPRQVTLILPVEVDMSKIRLSISSDGEDLNLEDVDCAITPHFDTIAGMVRDNAQGRSGIAYLPLIKSSKAFAAALRRAGVSAYHIDGSSPDRQDLLDRYARGEFSWLVNAGVMSTGVDLPIASAFLNLRLTRSKVQYQQSKGRVARVLPGVIDHLPEKEQSEERKALIAASAKPDFLVFDLLGDDADLSIVRPGDEYALSRDDCREIYERMKKERTPQDIAELARRIQEERELKLVEALERAAIRTSLATPMSPGEIGALLGDKMLAEYKPIQAWELAEPTPAQMRVLGARGVDLSSVGCRWEASRLIGLLGDRTKMGFATVKQVKMIRQLNERLPELERVLEPEKLSLQDAARTLKEKLPAASVVSAG